MNKDRRKERRLNEIKNKISRFLHRKRRVCAAALCVTMLFTNVATSIGSTGDDETAEFNVTSESLKEALKSAVESGKTVDNTYEFKGEEAEAYEELFEVDGCLYKLSPDIEDNTSKLSLSVYARVYEELVDEDGYEITGTEDIIFLLKNDTGKAQKAVIQVDNKTSEVITVQPKSEILVEDDSEDGDGPASEQADSGSSSGPSSDGTEASEGTSSVTPESAPADGTTDESETAAPEESAGGAESGSSKDNAGESASGNPEESEGTPEMSTRDEGEGESESGSPDESEGAPETDTPDESAGQPENTEPEEDTGSPENGTEEESTVEPDSGTSEDGSGNSSGDEPGTENGSGSDASDTDAGDTDSNGAASGTGNADSGDSGSDRGSGDADADNENDGGSDRPENSTDSNSEDDSGNAGSKDNSSDTSDSHSDSDSSDKGDSSSDSNDDSSDSNADSSDSADSGSERTAAEVVSISPYLVTRVTAAATPSEITEEEENIIEETEVVIVDTNEATPSEVEEEEDDDIASSASPSEATPSELKDPMEGEYYEAVRLGSNSVVAFVVKAEELGLDDKIFEASLENVLVRVTADRGVLPDDVELSVTELSENGDTAPQYQKAKAALDEAGTEYSGMMALDICFLDAEGNEIEPDGKAGEVRVAIEMASAFLPEDVDHNTLSVQHLKENEDGSIEVEQVADAADVTGGTVEKKDATESDTTVAEFSVQSFSTFTVTWNNGWGTTYFSMTVHCVSEDDVDKELTNDQTGYNISLSDTGTVTIPLSDYKKDIDDYIYKEARFASANGTVITHLAATSSSTNNWSKTRSVKLYNEKDPDNAPYNATYDRTQLQAEIWLVYQKEVVSLVDSISENGLLSAVLTNGATGDGYTFEWYKSETGGSNEGDWELVEREKVTGDSYNITESGMAVNVAYDDGARHYYKVKVYDEDGNLIGTSGEYFISYYDELQNGGFESPEVTSVGFGGSVYEQLSNGTENLIWQTTGSDKKIEITGYNPKPAYNFDYYVEGDQAAEINCEAYGSLYQDVLTAPGSTLYWRLAHIGRMGDDTMRVVIMSAPEAIAANITSQSAVTELYAAHPEYFQIPYNQDTVDIVDGMGTWNYYYGEYTVPEGQYVTRFFFVAVDAAGGSTQGNLVDDIWFSTELPPPNPDKGNLVVTKIVSGLSEDEVAQYKLKITVKGTGENNNSFVESRILENFTKNEDGTYSASGNLPNMSIGSYKVTETVLAPTSLPYEEPKVTVMQAVVGINGNAGEKTEVQPDTTAGYEIEVAERSTTNVELTNTYTKKPAILELRKLVAGNGGDKIASYKFTLKVNDVLVTNENKKVIITQGDDIVTVSAEGKFSLKHDKPVKITGLYVGDSITITEDDYSGEGYTTTVNDSDNPSSSYTIDTLSETQTVTFTNTKTITPPTGIFTNNLPFLMMMAIAFCGMAAFLVSSYKKRRYRA